VSGQHEQPLFFGPNRFGRCVGTGSVWVRKHLKMHRGVNRCGRKRMIAQRLEKGQTLLVSHGDILGAVHICVRQTDGKNR